jgi:hypothetical protein
MFEVGADMSAVAVIQKLKSIGYQISIDDQDILLESKNDPPDPELVKNLLEELRKCKAEAVSILKMSNTPIEKSQQFSGGEVIPFPPDWLKRFDEEQLERMAIMTVDGGLSDAEAIEATICKFCEFANPHRACIPS